MAVKTVADLLVATLEAAGVDTIWGLPGDSLNGLTESLRKRDRIRWRGVRHEEAAPSPPAPRPTPAGVWRSAPAPAVRAICT